MSVHEKFKNFEEDQRNFFDSLITEDWSTYLNTFWDFTRQWEVKKIITTAREAKRILDVGCGCGYHDILFASHSSIEYVLGLDYSEQSVIAANNIYPHNKVERKCIDFLNTDEFYNFDIAVSFQVIEHLKNYESFLQKMANSVSENGYVIVATPNYNRFSNRVRNLFGKKPLLSDVMHYKEFNIKDMKLLGEKVGLKIEKYFGHSISLNIINNIDRYIPKKILFYIGVMFPTISNIILVVYKKK